MSDPHQQANAQQIEWLLGALTESEPGGRADPEQPADLPSPQDDTAEPGELH